MAHPEPDQELFRRLRMAAGSMPADSEMQRLLLSLDDPVHDEASKDRYVALVCGAAVEEALKIALANWLLLQVDDPIFAGKLSRFDDRIKQASKLKIITTDEALELNRIRFVRNAFAHALTSISFDMPEVQQITRRMWHHPVASWTGYFAPVFAPRHHFAIVCGEFFSNLIARGPSPAGSGIDKQLS